MRAAARGTATGLVVLVAAGCGTTTASPPVVRTAEVRTQASCLDAEVLDALALELDPSLRTADAVPTMRGRPPQDFVADTVLVCDRGSTLRDSAGTWWAVTATRLEGDLAPLVDVVTGEVSCGPGVVAQVWLVDAMGSAVLLPREAACATEEVGRMLGDLAVVDRTEHPVALVQQVGTTPPGA